MNFPADSTVPELLRLGDSISILPVIHGSGQFSLTVRRWLLENDFDCIAIPLPQSFQKPVEEAVLELPQPSIVIQSATPKFGNVGEFDANQWGAESWSEDAAELSGGQDDAESPPLSYVPIDPCQPVIMAIRAAMGEHIPRAFIDLETDPFLSLIHI